jgi:uncharacterized membrane protein
MPLAVETYELSLFLHITAVVVGFGSTFAEAVMFPVAMKMGSRFLPYVHRLQLVLNQFFATPAILIVLATGLYQVEEGNWGYGDLWVSGTLAIVAVVALINLAFFIPVDRKLLPLIEKAVADSGGKDMTLSELPEEYQRWGKLEGALGGVTGLLLIAAIYMMVTKPGL